MSWVESIVNPFIPGYRRLTAAHRALPDFLIIGAQKSGTSSLYHYMSQHPQLLPSCKKEVHYFDGGLKHKVDKFKRGQVWYRSHFPLKRNLNADQKVFEATPLYIFNPLAPQRIFELIPEVKLIAILRNPAERAISHYFHQKRRGRETLPVMEALQAEEERLKPLIERKDYKHNSFIHHSYKSRGLYHEQLSRYLGYFSMNNILVLNSENFFADPGNSLRRVFQFVGVDTEYAVEDLEPRKVGSNRTEVDTDVYEYLGEYFRPYNQALYELLGQDFGWS